MCLMAGPLSAVNLPILARCPCHHPRPGPRVSCQPRVIPHRQPSGQARNFQQITSLSLSASCAPGCCHPNSARQDRDLLESECVCVSTLGPDPGNSVIQHKHNYPCFVNPCNCLVLCSPVSPCHLLHTRHSTIRGLSSPTGYRDRKIKCLCLFQ